MEGKNRRGAQHTPTPWRVGRESDGDMYERGYDFSAPGCCTYYFIMEAGDPAAVIFAESDAAAKRRKDFIVKAANNHAELVAALQKVRQELWVDYCLRMGRTDVPAFEFNSRPHIRIIDAALSRVEEGK